MTRDKAICEAVDALRCGKLVVLPTDTVYGVAADPRVPGAVQRLFDVKGRDSGKPVALLAAGVEEVARYGVTLSALARKLAERFWPGPLTLVVRAGEQWEGFRVPDHDVALALLRSVGGVLRVSSANRSGDPPALTARDAVRSLGRDVDVVLDAGQAPGGVASTVVKIDGEKMELIREGSLSRAQLAISDA